MCFTAFAQGPKPARDRFACLILEANWPLRCRSTLSGKASEKDYARTAKVGDRWLPNSDDRITMIVEADSIQMISDAGPNDDTVYFMRGDVVVRTSKTIIRAERLSYTETELRNLALEATR